MKQQIGFWILICLLCTGILLYPYKKVEADTAAPEEKSIDGSITLRVLQGEQVEEMSLSDYLAGVVSGELGEDFPLEAQKAQAIAARTFTLRQAQEGKHPEGDVCTDSSCCQAWSATATESAIQAVRETDGLVLVYEEDLIEATYFSCSGGRTESAEAVWGNAVPYLQAVDSPGEEDAPRFREEIEVTTGNFAARLQTLHPELLATGKAHEWFGEITYTHGNGVDTVEICGILFRGTELRKLFGLRSTNIRFSVSDEVITISTLGYGHRVGLSQYGAKAMALEGQAYSQILSHYYKNTEIKRLSLRGEA